MNYGKYIIIEHLGHEIAIMFNPLLTHSDIKSVTVVSAGFFAVGANPTDTDQNDIGVDVFGKSVSLKKESRPQDSALLKKVLRVEIEY